MSSIKFEVKDNLSKYFNRLDEVWNKEEKFIMKELMISATGRHGDTRSPIAKKLMHEGSGGHKDYEYNPYLYTSGQDTSRWLYKKGETESEIQANYSGMEGYENADEFKVWVEFSEEFEEYLGMYDYGTAYNIVRNMNPYERNLERDYAFYQETGADKYASPGDAAHIGFVNRGMGEAADKQIPETLNRNVKRLLDIL
jgi:hypothetical protein